MIARTGRRSPAVPGPDPRRQRCARMSRSFQLHQSNREPRDAARGCREQGHISSGRAWRRPAMSLSGRGLKAREKKRVHRRVNSRSGPPPPPPPPCAPGTIICLMLLMAGSPRREPESPSRAPASESSPSPARRRPEPGRDSPTSRSGNNSSGGRRTRGSSRPSWWRLARGRRSVVSCPEAVILRSS